jgi:hypothetical protein
MAHLREIGQLRLTSCIKKKEKKHNLNRSNQRHLIVLIFDLGVLIFIWP